MSRTVFVLFHCNVRNTIPACQLPGLELIPGHPPQQHCRKKQNLQKMLLNWCFWQFY